jgi:valyl-tRNA synthetase
MKLLHPIMPFISEEIYQLLGDRAVTDSICVSSYPKLAASNETLLAEADQAIEIITAIREIRGKAQKKNHETVDVYWSGKGAISIDRFSGKITKLCKIAQWQHTTEDVKDTKTIVVKEYKFFVKTGEVANPAAEREKLLKELDYAKGFLASIEKKLSNEKFVANAPAQVLESENKKKEDALLKISMIEHTLGA